MRLTFVLLLIGYLGSALAEKPTLQECTNQQYESLKKGDWVKISLNLEWTKRQFENYVKAESNKTTKDPAPKACTFMTLWGSVQHKTKDYLVLQTYYSSKQKEQIGAISSTPSKLSFEKQTLNNIRIKATEMEYITVWTENEDPALPPAARK